MAGLAPSLNVVQVVPNNVSNPTLLATNNTGAPVLLINNSASNIWVSSVASFTPGSSGAIPLPGFTSALWEPSGPVYGVIDNGQAAPAVVIVTNALSSWSPSPIGIQLSIPVINTVLFNSGGGASPADVALPFDSGILDVHTFNSLNITAYFKAVTTFPDAASFTDLTINFYQDANATQLVQSYSVNTTNWNITTLGGNNEITSVAVPVTGQYAVVTYNKRFGLAGTGNLQIIGSSRSVSGLSGSQSPMIASGIYCSATIPVGNPSGKLLGTFQAGGQRTINIADSTGSGAINNTNSAFSISQYGLLNGVWSPITVWGGTTKQWYNYSTITQPSIGTTFTLPPGPFFLTYPGNIDGSTNLCQITVQ